MYLCVFSNTIGAENALQLLLNIEQFEYMIGPQIDTGVKVRYAELEVSLYSICGQRYHTVKHSVLPSSGAFTPPG